MMYAASKKSRNSAFWVSLPLSLGLGICWGLLTVRHREAAAVLTKSMPVFLLFWFGTFYLGLLLHTVIHEAGHLVFGLLTGYRLISFRIFGLLWKKENGRTCLKHMKLKGTAGQCLMAPPELQDGRIPVVLYNLGGVLLNLLASLVFAGIALLLPHSSLLHVILLLLASIGVYLALVNGLPLRAGLINNDGRNLLDLTRSQEAVRGFWAQLKLNELSTAGVRPRDLPESLAPLPTDASMQNPMTAAVGVVACSRLMDQHRFPEADALMAHLLSLDCEMVGMHRIFLENDRIFVELITENRPEALAQLETREFQKRQRAMQQFPGFLRTEYAKALLAEQNRDKAEKFRQRFEKIAETYPYAGDIQYERELMELAAARIA